MTSLTTNRSPYRLAKNPSGNHFEIFVSLGEPTAVTAGIKQACNGTLDGHMPVFGERYRPAIYHGYGQGRILIKLMVA